MTKIVRKFEVGVSPDRVYAAVSAPEKWPQWAGFVRQATTQGTKTHWIYDMGGMKVESDSEVKEDNPNDVYWFEQTKGFMKSGGTKFQIASTNDGSSVTWTTEYQLPYSYLGKLIDKLRAQKQFEKAIDESIPNLKKLLGEVK